MKLPRPRSTSHNRFALFHKPEAFPVFLGHFLQSFRVGRGRFMLALFWFESVVWSDDSSLGSTDEVSTGICQPPTVAHLQGLCSYLCFATCFPVPCVNGAE